MAVALSSQLSCTRLRALEISLHICVLVPLVKPLPVDVATITIIFVILFFSISEEAFKTAISREITQVAFEWC